MRESQRLRHILEAIELIERRAAAGRTRFFQDQDLQDSIALRLAVIGEAVKGLTQQTRERYPEIPWRRVAGMRDLLVHEYFRMDLEVVWHTVQDDVPRLKSVVQRMLHDLGE